jgi:predicted ferric reductase
MNLSIVPWGWYFARAGGLVAFALLYFSILLGLAIRWPRLRKILQPIYSCEIHCWISFQALIFAFLHAVSLLFDNYFSFSLKDIFIPWAFKSDLLSPALIAAGIIGFYLLVALVITSYLKKYIGQNMWRIVHFLNLWLYFFVLFHAISLGTDLKQGFLRQIFLALNGLLIILLLYSLISRLVKSFQCKTEVKSNEDQSQNFCSRVEE